MQNVHCGVAPCWLISHLNLDIKTNVSKHLIIDTVVLAPFFKTDVTMIDLPHEVLVTFYCTNSSKNLGQLL
ncbi:hypothetical protein EPR50_G00005710 [Perca flavescens]|uniref:Uncharacterized protein n=1 Tax=Perca flavescens TaxID=8167 RepID=A0A484DQ33_PERFV|nr:hypothetical protein EPR50_G00005710 [Perca flavescens]